MDFYQKLFEYKKKYGLKYRDFGELIDKGEGTFAKAVERQSLDEKEKSVLTEFFEILDREGGKPKKEPRKDPHGLCDETGTKPDPRKVAAFIIENEEDMLKVKQYRNYIELKEMRAKISASEDFEDRIRKAVLQALELRG